MEQIVSVVESLPKNPSHGEQASFHFYLEGFSLLVSHDFIDSVAYLLKALQGVDSSGWEYV